MKGPSSLALGSRFAHRRRLLVLQWATASLRLQDGGPLLA